MKTQPNPGKVQDLDSIRKSRWIGLNLGIAFLAILAGHSNVEWIEKIVLTFHVPLFFICEGLLYTAASWKDTLLDSVKRYLVPYLITGLILLGFFTLLGGWNPNVLSSAPSGMQWLKALLFGSGVSTPSFLSIGILWILLALFWGRILLKLVLSFPAGVQPILVFAFSFFGIYSGLWTTLPLSFQAGCVALFFEYAVLLGRSLLSSILELRLEIKLALLVVCLVVWLAFIDDPGSFYLVNSNLERGYLDLFASGCACICILSASWTLMNRMSVITDFLDFFGHHFILLLCLYSLDQWIGLTQWLVSLILPASSLQVTGLASFVAECVLMAFCLWIWQKVRTVFEESKSR